MTQAKQDLDGVHDYYCAARPVGGSIYDIWEDGGAFNDSITPSTFVPEYRSHIVLKILSLTAPRAEVFSIGCGNGFVESDLVERDRRVRAVDCNAEAVQLTGGKGVDAYLADYFALTPDDVRGSDLIYGDGLLGHLFDPDRNVEPALEKLVELDLRPGTTIVFSNDSPRSPEVMFAPHDRVEGFWFVARDYLQERLGAAGFTPIEHYYFPYLRPISGMRNRTICVARVPG